MNNMSLDDVMKQIKFKQYQREQRAKQPEYIAAVRHENALYMHKRCGLPYRICLDLIKNDSKDMPGVWYPLSDCITYGEYMQDIKGVDVSDEDMLKAAPFPRTTDKIDTLTYKYINGRIDEETFYSECQTEIDRERGYSLFNDKWCYYYAHFLSDYDISAFTVFNLYGVPFYDAEETNAYMNLLETLQGRFKSKPRSFYKPKIK